jgi:hypothetical protein
MKSDVDLKGISFRRVLYFFILTDFFLCIYVSFRFSSLFMLVVTYRKSL